MSQFGILANFSAAILAASTPLKESDSKCTLEKTLPQKKYSPFELDIAYSISKGRKNQHYRIEGSNSGTILEMLMGVFS